MRKGFWIRKGKSGESWNEIELIQEVDLDVSYLSKILTKIEAAVIRNRSSHNNLKDRHVNNIDQSRPCRDHPRKNGFTQKRSQKIVETILKIINGTSASGADVLISGFGKFCVKHKSEKTGRNPATGSTMVPDKRKVVTFKSSGLIKRKMNKH